MLRREAEDGATLLGEELSGPLTVEVESAGEGSCSGATRSKIVEAREQLMGRLLAEGLVRYPDQGARPVWSYPERDKLSSQWLLALPGQSNSLTAAEFSECSAALLCQPSPACATKLGEAVGRGASVDMFGDTVMAQVMQGDGWRKRHDQVKMRLLSLFRWCGMEVDCEVFNLFSALIPQEGLARIDQGRKRQGLVPDFKVRLPPGDGRPVTDELALAELKVITSCPTRYQRNPRNTTKAVDRRAALLPGEYARHARNIDRVYGGVEEGVVGPVEAKLLSFPPLQRWVFGAWGEVSQDVHTLVHTLAMARQKYQHVLEGRERWRRISDAGELAILTGQIRRSLSLEGVRSQARCLLSRLDGIGAGAAAAARRRGWSALEERRMEKERRAHSISLSQGRLPLRRGEFLFE